MTVKEIVKEYLIKHGYDGLYYDKLDFECKCKTNNLFPCEYTDPELCKAGYLQNCKKCQHWHDNKCQLNKNFCIGNKKDEGKTMEKRKKTKRY